MQTVFDKCKKSIKDLETHNSQLIEALTNLLNEDDIKSIPSYELLKGTYSMFTKLQKNRNDASDISLNYDPIHAPPNIRRATKKQLKANLSNVYSETIKESKPKEDKIKIVEKEKSYSEDMPDLDECILSSPVAKKKPTVKKIEELPVKAVGDIYLLEIKGNHYYLYENYLYNKTTLIREGEININGFTVNNTNYPFESSHVTLENKCINEDFPDFYQGLGESSRGIYTKLKNIDVVQSVGEVSDENELMLW